VVDANELVARKNGKDGPAMTNLLRRLEEIEKRMAPDNKPPISFTIRYVHVDEDGHPTGKFERFRLCGGIYTKIDEGEQ
jgi:hypothetical protein